MHSNIAIQAASGVSERLTLVLLAREASRALDRALHHYAGFQGAIVVLDTAPQAQALAGSHRTFEHLHRPALAGSSLAALTAEALRQVATPLVVVADVDSFLLVDALDEAVRFLDAHEHYVACQGYSLTYRAGVDHVDYLRRDRKIVEDYAQEDAGERVLDFLSQGLPLLNAVVRTEVLQAWATSVAPDTGKHWEELGHMLWLLAKGKLRILPIPYAVHGALSAEDENRRDNAIRNALKYVDPKSRAEREEFAQTLAGQLAQGAGSLSADQIMAGLAALCEAVSGQHYLARDWLVRSRWNVSAQAPEPFFEPRQFVELPFYNPGFFKSLEQIEFLLHLMPSGAEQMQALEAALLRQAELARMQTNPDAESLKNRLWQAYALYSFNAGIVHGLIDELLKEARDSTQEAGDELDDLIEWRDRLGALGQRDNGQLLNDMESGRLLSWLDARHPAPAELEALTRKLAGKPAGSEVAILLLDLDGDLFKLQTTFDSLINGFCRTFKVVIFSTSEPPAVTTLQNTLHFVKVSESNYIDRINQTLRQSPSDWLMLAQAGDVFTATGLLQAATELTDADNCRAVAMDEVHRQADGTLAHVMRPDFNLDLLQSSPGLMARHWLVRRQALVEAGGYSREFPAALEFDLLLRLIEQGGMNGLAHLSEPLLITQAPEAEVNDDERKALARHLRNRGYQAEVSPVLPGVFKIDYRHTHRPVVSVLIQAQDNLPELQRCLQSILQRTRYPRYEVLVGDNGSVSPQVSAWLKEQEAQSNRVRSFRTDQPLPRTAMLNQLCEQAKGEYLVLLDADSQIVNVGWIESMLNQALRPEVGVVGAKLIDAEGSVTQAGLILGFAGGVGSAFVGAPKHATGYMQRLVVEQNCSAVSAACLMIEKALFEGLGGLDEGVFADAFADVDLCLKAGAAGYLTVWTPQVLVVHPGTLGQSSSALQALREKWAAAFEHDTAYNRHLALEGSGYTLQLPA